MVWNAPPVVWNESPGMWNAPTVVWNVPAVVWNVPILVWNAPLRRRACSLYDILETKNAASSRTAFYTDSFLLSSIRLFLNTIT